VLAAKSLDDPCTDPRSVSHFMIKQREQCLADMHNVQVSGVVIEFDNPYVLGKHDSNVVKQQNKALSNVNQS
jgi:hypothetical protein